MTQDSPSGQGWGCGQCHHTAGRASPLGLTGTLKAIAPACSSQNPSSPPGRPHGQLPGTSGSVIGISVEPPLHDEAPHLSDGASGKPFTISSCLQSLVQRSLPAGVPQDGVPDAAEGLVSGSPVAVTSLDRSVMTVLLLVLGVNLLGKGLGQICT